MSKYDKKTLQANFLSQYQNIFRCPICFQPMRIVQLASIICSKNHCFDLSKRGYVNFLSRSIKTKYNKTLFESRRMIWKNGLFERLSKEIVEQMRNERITKKEQMTIFDAGCGEGSLLFNIQKKMTDHTTNKFLGIGMDISKEGIDIAARDYPNIIWCVGDMVNCPFDNRQFNFILNILSPSNYVEFKRILASDGFIMKVIPNQNYLQELRSFFYKHKEEKVYSNQDTILHFRKYFKLLDMKRLQYPCELDHSLLKPLIQMTPLSWGITEKQIKQFLNMKTGQITIDLTILVGKPY